MTFSLKWTFSCWVQFDLISSRKQVRCCSDLTHCWEMRECLNWSDSLQTVSSLTQRHLKHFLTTEHRIRSWCLLTINVSSSVNTSSQLNLNSVFIQKVLYKYNKLHRVSTSISVTRLSTLTLNWTALHECWKLQTLFSLSSCETGHWLNVSNITNMTV